jgi:hypothetical protein
MFRLYKHTQNLSLSPASNEAPSLQLYKQKICRFKIKNNGKFSVHKKPAIG